MKKNTAKQVPTKQDEPTTIGSEPIAEEGTPEPVQKTSDQLAAEYLAGWQRALADYENLKRSSSQERMEFARYANTALIQDLIPTIDYFDAAMRQTPNTERCDEATQKEMQNWLLGMQHVQKLLLDKLTEQGLIVLEPTGIYNPNEQESAEERESDQPEGTILQVLQRGFKLFDKLIRPARVVVAKAPVKNAQ
ncbi:TPA: nucleotide exchange factor GrpE [Candidatus Uhrbacteria bacterium]|nr:nucleotide exchange factor GrpE [Candidatus Uhrbacteria bacterium]